MARGSSRGRKTADQRRAVQLADETIIRGEGGETHQIATGEIPVLTTQQGIPIADDQNSLRVGPHGPTALEDFHFREKIFHFDHERIPERVVHARGFGAHGYFENDDGTGPQLFFNRNPAPIGNGGDIYVSTQAEDGTWGTAVPVAELNSAASDQRPSIASNGLEIFFFSDRPGSMSYDIWHATRPSVLARWDAPTNLGAPINTAVAEVHPFIYSHGQTEMLFFARNVATPPAVDLDLFVSTRTREKP